jgi:outer membrane protein TolC
VEPDVSALPLDVNRKPPARPTEYRRLTANECRALAAKSAPFADDLDNHPDNTAPNHPHLHPLKPTPAEAAQGRLVRGYAADELRNRAAGDALEQFFQLAEAEGQFDLLAKSLAELRTRLTEAEEALKRGLADRAGVDTLRVQVLDLEAQVAKLEAGIGSLNAALRARLDLDPRDPLPLWPDDPLRVAPGEPDVEEAVRTGLLYRPDLNLLRALLADQGRAADDLMQTLLKQVSPLLARLATNPLVGILLPNGTRHDREATRRQVASMLSDRERQAEAEIRSGVLTLRGHRLAAVATAAEVRRLTAKVQEVEKRAAAGQQVTAELTKARLDLWKAQGELLKSAADWNRAEAKLRQAMGLLVRE